MIVGWQQMSRPFDADRLDWMLNDFISNLRA
jgi:hypothetical protein